MAAKRVHLLLLMRTIEKLAPRAVLEVGSGTGLNLLLLSARFPAARFFGVEITSAGVLATRCGAASALPPEVVAFSPEPVADVAAVRRIVVVEGSAAALPFSDASFDLVFTVQALEQMEEIGLAHSAKSPAWRATSSPWPSRSASGTQTA